MTVHSLADSTFITGRFQAMGCPCEILIDTSDTSLAADLLRTGRHEAERIEAKFSRYLTGTIVDRINRSVGKRVEVDIESANLLDYAAECYELSGGLFDITTGVLRKGFKPGTIGWDKVSWNRPFIQIPADFEIDLGGICKEYAADRILNLLMKRQKNSVLVNLGGDIAAAGSRIWSVGIEDVVNANQIARTLHLRQGGLATSGTTKRSGHIVDPRSGLPVKRAPLSVTVTARTCTEAGFWSTLAILQGSEAESFLDEQSLEFWCYRSS